MASRLLRPDDPSHIYSEIFVPPETGGGLSPPPVTIAITEDGEMRCSCNSWQYPCTHMVEWIKTDVDVPTAVQRGFDGTILYTFDFSASFSYEIPLFYGEVTRVDLIALRPPDLYTRTIVLRPEPMPNAPTDPDHFSGSRIVGFFDERYEGRRAIRNLILDWLAPWQGRLTWNELKCKRLPFHSVNWDDGTNQLLQIHHLLMHGVCTSCVADMRAEVPDI